MSEFTSKVSHPFLASASSRLSSLLYLIPSSWVSVALSLPFFNLNGPFCIFCIFVFFGFIFLDVLASQFWHKARPSSTSMSGTHGRIYKTGYRDWCRGAISHGRNWIIPVAAPIVHNVHPQAETDILHGVGLETSIFRLLGKPSRLHPHFKYLERHPHLLSRHTKLIQ